MMTSVRFAIIGMLALLLLACVEGDFSSLDAGEGAMYLTDDEVRIAQEERCAYAATVEAPSVEAENGARELEPEMEPGHERETFVREAGEEEEEELKDRREFEDDQAALQFAIQAASVEMQTCESIRSQAKKPDAGTKENIDSKWAG